jgi:hypothetical protein
MELIFAKMVATSVVLFLFGIGCIEWKYEQAIKLMRF